MQWWGRDINTGPYAYIGRAQQGSAEMDSVSVSLFGASTPQAFFDALTGGNKSDGFMNRLLIATGAPRAPDEEPEIDGSTVPENITRALIGVLPRESGDLSQVMDVFGPASHVPKRKLLWASPEVAKASSDFSKSIDKAMSADPDREDLMGRIFEYSIRLASLHAVSRAIGEERIDPSTAEITFSAADASVDLRDLAWGVAWATESARILIDKSESMMAPNEYGNDKNRVKDAIKKAGTISRSELLRQVQHVKSTELNGILDQLHEANLIATLASGDEPKKGAGRPSKSYRWIGP
jgi:hypothetical protein